MSEYEGDRRNDGSSGDSGERRRKGEANYVCRWWRRRLTKAIAVIGVITTITGVPFLSLIIENWPISRAEAQDAHAQIDRRLDDGDARDDQQDARLGAIERRLASMDRTGLLSLQLQLQTRLDAIERDIRSGPPAGVLSTLQETRRGLQQQLQEVERQLDNRVR